jgi:sulfate transport system substrate-binding protein
MRNPVQKITVVLIALIWLFADGRVLAANAKILSVSSDLTKGFYQDYNVAFAAHWKQKTSQTIVINQSSGDSTKQAQSIIDAVDADVVALDRSDAVDVLSSKGRFLDANWTARLPDKSLPFTSTIVFVVRKGNPKDIRNWSDLIRPDVSIIATSPKTSDNGRYGYLAAWGYALKKSAGDENQARNFVAKLYAHVPVLDTDADDATSAFADDGIGDVLLIVESRAAFVQKQFSKDRFEVVLPPTSIRVDNVVTWVDHMVERHDNEAVARAYLEYLYSDEGQELAAQHFFRPGNETILQRYSTRYKPLELYTVDEIAGSWQKAQRVHFADGGVFDQIYHPDDSP